MAKKKKMAKKPVKRKKMAASFLKKGRNKGVTQLIAVILLITITIVLLAVYFAGFLGMQLNVENYAQNASQNNIRAVIKIDGVSNSNIYLRNKGENGISNSSISIYINDVKVPFNLSGNLQSGRVGALEIEPLTPGYYTIKVTAADSASDMVDVMITSAYIADVSLTGLVQDAVTEEPLAGADIGIFFSGWQESDNTDPIFSNTSVAGGTFAVYNVSSGSYIIRAMRSGYQNFIASMDLSTSQSDVLISMVPVSTTTTSTTTTTTSSTTTTVATTTTIVTTTTVATTTTTVKTTTTSTTTPSTTTTVRTTTTSTSTSSTTTTVRTTTTSTIAPTTTTVPTTTTTIACSSTSLGSPSISPPNPYANSAFQILCPASSTTFDCIRANSTAGVQCTWTSWSGLNAVFNCNGLPASAYTAACAAATGTASNCCAATRTTSYIVISTTTTTVTPTTTTIKPTTTTSTTTSSTTTTISNPYFFDNFDDREYASTWTVNRGTFSATNQYLEQTTSGLDYMQIVSNQPNFPAGTNMKLEYDIMLPTGTGCSDNQVYLRMGTSYFLVSNIRVDCTAAGGSARLYVGSQSVYTTMPITRGQWYHVKVYYSGSQWVMELGGTPLLTSTYATPSGTVNNIMIQGQQVNAGVRFDNIYAGSASVSTTTTTISGATLYGYVRNATSGVAVQGMNVVCRTCGCGSTVTNSQGYYSFSGVPEGTCTIAVENGNMYIGMAKSVGLLSGQSTQSDFSLDTSGWIYGYVKDGSNNPITNAEIATGYGFAYTSSSGYYITQHSISPGPGWPVIVSQASFWPKMESVAVYNAQGTRKDWVLIPKTTPTTTTTTIQSTVGNVIPCYNLSLPTPNGYGDVNGDGWISKEDYLILFNDQCGSYTNGCKRGDVNNNGRWDFDDIVKIFSYANGVSSSLPVCNLSFMTPPCYNTSLPSPRGYGDVNGNGYVSNDDMMIIFNDQCGSYTNGCERGDVNNNGRMDFADLASVYSFLNGYMSTMPVCNLTYSKTRCHNLTLPTPNGYGDVNGDGFVSTEDYQIIFNNQCGSYTNGCKRADVNSNGGVDFGDLLAVYNYIIGVNSTMPVCNVG